MKKILLAICASVLCFSTGVKADETVKVGIETKKQARWLRLSRVNFSNKDLMGYDRNVDVYFEADQRGVITFAKIVQSSGIENLDNKVLTSIKMSRMKPYQENGVYYNFAATQPFSMMLSREAQYRVYPNISMESSYLRGKDRSVVIYAEADENGNVTKAEIKKSSGLAELDDYVLSEYIKQAKFEPLNINGKPYPISKTSTFKFSQK